MKMILLIALSACVNTESPDQLTDYKEAEAAYKCGWGSSTVDLHPEITIVADDTVTMTSEAWTMFGVTAIDLTTFMKCRALPRCGEIPTLPLTGRPVTHDDLVTVSFRDWESKQVWVTLTERWLTCAD